jgi:peptide-methionine (R)-S-oxide reductase
MIITRARPRNSRPVAGGPQARCGGHNGGPLWVASIAGIPAASSTIYQGADMTGNYRKDPEAVSRLTPEQYRITQKNGTEPPFRNEHWDNKEPGIYVDVVSGEPLFASISKFDSHTGWPSFTVPIEPGNVVQRRDFKMLIPRTEVRSAHGDSHLGHVFHDGPKEAGGLRYCINSAALRFIPVDNLEREGYGAYRKLFEPADDTASPS